MIRFIPQDAETAVDLFEDDDPAELMGKRIVGQFPAHVRPFDQSL